MELPKQRSNARKGGVNLIIVLFLAVVATVVIATVQSRLLLQIRRNRAQSDILITDYHAESTIYDLLARLTYPQFSLPAGQTTLPTLADGTTITIDNTTTATIQNIVITAKRPFAVSTINLIRKTAVTNQAAYDKIELLVALDCSDSMKNRVKTGVTTTRIDAAKTALTNFVNTIYAPTNIYRDRYHIGMSAFRDNARWMKAADNTDLIPTNDQSRILATITKEIGMGSDGEPKCYKSGLFGNTSVGSGLAFTNDYFSAHPVSATTKRIQIIITDGLSISRIPYAACPPSFYCAAIQQFCTNNADPSFYRCEPSRVPQCFATTDPDRECPQCQPYAYDFVSCTLSNRGTTYQSLVDNQSYAGTHDPNVETYVLTVYGNITNDTRSQQMHAIFTNLLGDHYFEDPYADNLNTILSDRIFGDINSAVSTISIQKI